MDRTQHPQSASRRVDRVADGGAPLLLLRLVLRRQIRRRRRRRGERLLLLLLLLRGVTGIYVLDGEL